jgi:ABC-2 type transport system ATP-binding protein
MFDKNITVLFVSHSVDQVLRICNKAIILDHGKIIAQGSAEEICAQYEIMTNGGKK